MNLRRGFRRLTLVFWVLVVAGVVASMGLLTSPSPLFPFREIGPDGDLRPDVPPECLVEASVEDAPGLSLSGAWERVERLRCRAKRAQLEEWEATAVPAFRTEAYRSNLRNTALAIALATALIWGLFLVLGWVAAGFRSEGR